jgi:hypothetical protein
MKIATKWEGEAIEGGAVPQSCVLRSSVLSALVKER